MNLTPKERDTLLKFINSIFYVGDAEATYQALREKLNEILNQEFRAKQKPEHKSDFS